MGELTCTVLVPGDDESEAPQTAEEKAAEEKASRRHLYICARDSAANLSLWLQAAELGMPDAIGKEEQFRRSLERAQKHIATLESEFADDPEVEDVIQGDIEYLCSGLRESIAKFKAKQSECE